MLYKIVPFLIWFHRFSTLVGKVKVPLLKDVLPEKRTKSQLQPSGLALLILLPANQFTGPNRRNMLNGGFRVAGFESSVCHSAKTSAQ
ncbi:MAG: hypothetical protein MK481_11730 [SAR324 cluster bacterium]|nr:hypothetical protein [SAR324 cluster bacterium]